MSTPTAEDDKTSVLALDLFLREVLHFCFTEMSDYAILIKYRGAFLYVLSVKTYYVVVAALFRGSSSAAASAAGLLVRVLRLGLTKRLWGWSRLRRG